MISDNHGSSHHREGGPMGTGTLDSDRLTGASDAHPLDASASTTASASAPEGLTGVPGDCPKKK